jgi:hypothetical protein
VCWPRQTARRVVSCVYRRGTMIKLLPELKPQDEAEMRALYQSLGISEATTEAAIKVRHNTPVKTAGRPSPLKGKKRKPHSSLTET